jgi:hypothetical protein
LAVAGNAQDAFEKTFYGRMCIFISFNQDTEWNRNSKLMVRTWPAGMRAPATFLTATLPDSDAFVFRLRGAIPTTRF